MTKAQDPVDYKRYQFTPGFRELVKKAPDVKIDLGADNLGLPMTTDFENHLTALWELQKSRKVCLQQLIKVVPTDFDW
jgi:hypothetical protein